MSNPIFDDAKASSKSGLCPDPDVERAMRAFTRARMVLLLARREGLPEPSVELFADGSGRFIFPGRLALALKDAAEEITNLIGSTRLEPAYVVGDADAVAIAVCETLGREED